jgi:hypothetical protein
MAEKKKCAGKCKPLITKESPVFVDMFHGSQKAVKAHFDKLILGKELVSVEFSEPNATGSYLMLTRYKLVV